MEDALRVENVTYHMVLEAKCLNPCSNGRCSARPSGYGWNTEALLSLNPCSNGRCSASSCSHKCSTGVQQVLILVLMEDALRVLLQESSKFTGRVLILVLMEDALRE